MSKAGGISIHGVDVARGIPAKGLRVELHRLEPQPALIAEGRLAGSGALDHPVTQGQDVIAGLYEVRFHVGPWLHDSAGTPGILDIVPFRFIIAAPEQHYHLPFKFTPWGFSLFRGS